MSRTVSPNPVRPSPVASETPKYEALLNESMRLFNLKGYRDTSMEDIAMAVGMPASGIYRYFSGKSDILAAAFRRAADRLSGELSVIVGTVPDREEALTAVIDAYVTRSFDRPELDYVYYTERLNMTPGDQKILRNLQRANVESWVDLVVSVRPDWTPGQARFAVHAAMSLVIDLGRLMRYREFGADPCGRGTAAGPDAARPLPVARCVACQVGHVTDRADDRQRAASSPSSARARAPFRCRR